jgi:uncharacterized protein YaiE (UPF0345 family)
MLDKQSWRAAQICLKIYRKEWPMKIFKNVDVNALANFYFDGQVSSRTLTLASGENKTLGVMLPGEYRFDTAKRELMEIQAGKVEVLLPGQTEWQAVESGGNFKVPAKAAFDIKVLEPTDYCCSYFD